MMHAHPMPAISVAIIVRVGTLYDSHHHWRNEAGELRASVSFDAGGTSYGHIQGPPAALRELAAALIEAADQADAAGTPTPTQALVEGVAG
jgi:major membrane immunogen (membrane-anchored lipoprotein)